jgi:glycosyltransferase involved in cell wall biosynthesis
MDAVVVHSRHGAARLVDELGVDPGRVEVIGHGAFEHLTALAPALPPELRDSGAPVVLFLGLIRPYKGLDVLYDAWRGVEGAQLWVAGLPKMELPDAPPGVQVVPRFVSEPEVAGLLRRADVVVLPYRDIDQSGVLHAARAFGKPLILSDVGGFPEVQGARLVPAGDAEALREALRDPPRSAPAAGTSWDDAARAHLALYRRLL